MIAEHAIASRSYVIETIRSDFTVPARPSLTGGTAAPGIAHDWSFRWDPQPNIVYPGPGDDNSGDDTVNGTNDVDQINGGAGNDIIKGKGESDTLTGGEPGDDQVYGGDGNDDIVESNGHDLLFGGNDNDTITVRGFSQATGGFGDDVLHLGAFNGINEAEHVIGTIEGGIGIDTLLIGGMVSFEIPKFNAAEMGFENVEAVAFTGDGSDNELDFSGVTNIGTVGLDIDGLGGDDKLVGTDSATLGDTLKGGLGDDRIEGRDGDDSCIGGADRDYILAGDGGDTLYGGDFLAAYNSHTADYLDGGSGKDTINVSFTGTAFGQGGNDVIRLDNTIIGKVNVHFASIDGGMGTDTLDLGDGCVFALASFSFATAGFEKLDDPGAITGDDAGNELDFSGAAVLNATQVTFNGQGGDDKLTGTAIDDVMHGGAGNDFLYGGLGSDLIVGDSNRDYCLAGGGNDSLNGGDLLASYNADTADYLDGEDGNDIITVGFTATAFGGAGDDIIHLADTIIGKIALNPLASINGGADSDTLDLDTGCVFALAKFDFTDAQFEILDNPAPIMGDGNANKLNFSGAQVINTTQVTFDGQAGDDDLTGTNIDDVMHGGIGNDSLAGIDGHNQLFGDADNDTLYGGGNDDVLDGGAGIDAIYGGKGKDHLTDTGTVGEIDAGKGTDIVELSACIVTEASLIEGGGGNEDAILSTFDTVWANFDASAQGFEQAGGNFFGDNNANVIDLTGAENFTGMTIQVFAGNGDDQISVSADNSRVDAQGNNDIVLSEGDNCQVYGGAGQDDCTVNGAACTIDLGDSDDTAEVNAEGGSSTVNGGTGFDNISFGFFTLPFADSLAQKLGREAGSTQGITIDLANTGAQATGAGSYTITNIEHVSASELDDTVLGNSLGNILNGLGGNDALTGRTGADTLTGGVGNDDFIYLAQNEGGDTVTDFSSSGSGDNDTFDFLGSVFSGLAAGDITAGQFQSDVSNVALMATVRFFYETDTGILRFDADGSGGGAAVTIATLQPGATMTFHDIEII